MCETRNFYLWLLQIVVLVGLLVFFLWLSLRPSEPTYTIFQFSIPTPGNSSSPENQNGTVSFGLDIENPNKDSGIYYDDTLLTFYYGQDSFGQKTLPSFYQKKDTSLQILDHVNGEAQVLRKLINALSNATAELKVAVATKIRYRMWGHTSKHQGINLHGKLPIGSNGKISGKKKKIKLRSSSKKRR